MSETAATPMPLYKSHKEVWALKVKSVEPIPVDSNGYPCSSLSLTFEDEGFAPRTFTEAELEHKPMPEAGMYMVQYEDGYISFSPGKAFEDGYTRV